MKILWVSPNFLHPTTKGGQIRTLEMLRCLHGRHEIQYVALDDPAEPEGLRRADEYSSRAYPVPRHVPPRRSAAFLGQLAGSLVSPLPLAVSRYRSEPMQRLVNELLTRERFDHLVCDFLFVAPNIPRLGSAVLFQHNVETTIWRRHAETAPDPFRKAYFGLQARRMFAYECDVCRQVRHIISVSEKDAARLQEMCGDASHVSQVPTGVDIDYFAPPPSPPRRADLVFAGSMDWMPNIDAVSFFVEQILPLIRRSKPDCSLIIAGRTPPPRILEMGARDANIQVTGTVPDIRPYMWGSAVSIVPLRIGGGTRLKIYEAMAARIPTVSTTTGAEGLPVTSGKDIFLADSPADFAARCLDLLADASLRARLAAAAWDLVSSRFRWEHAALCFERILEGSPPPQG
jgi:glycosyltransferase involved in cell wall biosynthesis